jgi:hypothetical protein
MLDAARPLTDLPAARPHQGDGSDSHIQAVLANAGVRVTESIIASMTPSQLARQAAHLRSTVEIFGVLTDPQVLPHPGSAADRELAEI